MRKSRSCGVLVVYGDPIAEFLLMKHRTRWDLPKGHVDPGESDIECALRELQEETGIDAKDIELDPDFQFSTSYPVRYKKSEEVLDKTLIIYLGRLRKKLPIRPTEHPGFEWFAWNPPHQIQIRTIDPLLGQLADFLQGDRPAGVDQ